MLNYALLGTGYGASIQAKAIQNGNIFNPISVCDLNVSRAKEVRRQFGFKYHTDSWQEALEYREVNCAIVALPPKLHFSAVKHVIKLGLHVIVASPFTLNLTEAEELLSMVEKKEQIFAVDYHLNYVPVRRYALELIKSGKIGRLGHVVRTYRQKIIPIETDISSWKLDKTAGGGLFMEIVPHDIDFLLRCCGGIHQVKGQIHTTLPTRFTEEGNPLLSTADDTLSLELDFHNGIKGHISSSSTSALKEMDEFAFYGSAGVLVIENNSELILFDEKGIRRRLAIPPAYQLSTVPGAKDCTSFFAFSEAFASAVFNGTHISPTFDEAIHTQRVLNAVLNSFEDHEYVAIGEEEKIKKLSVKPPPPIDKIF